MGKIKKAVQKAEQSYALMRCIDYYYDETVKLRKEKKELEEIILRLQNKNSLLERERELTIGLFGESFWGSLE